MQSIFVMLLRCDFRKLAKLSGRMIAIFLGCSVTLAIGFIIGFPIFKSSLGGGETIWGATAALYASWVGGSANMAAMQDALPVDPGAYACALTLDTVCYSVWIALLIFMVRYSSKWDKSVKADTSKLSAIADVANEEVEKEKKAKATSGDWVWMIGLALIVSALSQWVGAKMGAGFAGMGLKMFDKGTCTTLFVTVLGLVCAMTPLGKLPAANELSSVLLYAVVALLATQAPLNALIEAPMWVVYGVFILVLHVVGMYILSKLFHWDLCMVSTASVANIGGPASAPIIAVAYNPNYAGIGVLMGIFGQAVEWALSRSRHGLAAQPDGMSSLPTSTEKRGPARSRQVPLFPRSTGGLSMNSNDNLRFLNVGLPDDIARRKAWGDFLREPYGSSTAASRRITFPMRCAPA